MSTVATIQLTLKSLRIYLEGEGKGLPKRLRDKVTDAIAELEEKLADAVAE